MNTNFNMSQKSGAERVHNRRLTWLIGALAVILVGQANEFAFAFAGNGRLFSPIAAALSIAVIWHGIPLFRKRDVGLPALLLVATLCYSLCVGAIVSAPSVAIADSWPETSKPLRSLFTFCCLFVGFMSIAKLGQIRLLANVLTCTAAAVVSFQVASYVLGYEPSLRGTSPEANRFRYSGILPDPNQAASFATLLLCITPLSSVPKPVKVMLATLSIAGVIATFSRGGIVTMLAVVASNVAVGKSSYRLVYLLGLVVTGVLVLLGIPWSADRGLLEPQALRHLTQLHDLLLGNAEITDNSRGQLLVEAIATIEAHPIVGYGFHEYGTPLVTAAHNMYAHFALIAGLPAMALYTCTIVALGAFGLALRRDSERRYVTSISVWMAIMGLSLHTLLDEKYSLTFLALAFAMASSHSPPRRDTNTSRLMTS